MKLNKSLLAVLATGLLSCTFFAPDAKAVPVTGEVRFAGTAMVNAFRTAFTSFQDVFVLPGAANATGDFAGTNGTPVTMTPFQYNPFAGPVIPLWTFTFGGSTYSFDLLAAVAERNDANFIVITGTGNLRISGAITRDTTFGVYRLTANNSDNGFDFGFSSSTASVPEGGSAIALLGVALLGVEVARRKLRHA